MSEENGNKRLEALLSEHLKQDRGRLDRIEQKIDKLSDTVVAIARAEEKLVNLEVARKEIAHRLDDQDHRIDKVEGMVGRNTATIDNIRKFFWTFLAAILPVAITFFLLTNQG